jgi:hypothetical protein
MTLITLRALEIGGVPVLDDPSNDFQVRSHIDPSLVILKFFNGSVTIQADALQFAIEKAVEGSLKQQAASASK